MAPHTRIATTTAVKNSFTKSTQDAIKRIEPAMLVKRLNYQLFHHSCTLIQSLSDKPEKYICENVDVCQIVNQNNVLKQSLTTFSAPIAQSARHQSSEQKVGGSSPFKCQQGLFLFSSRQN